MRSSVDLPEPEVPTITVIELRAMRIDTPSTTRGVAVLLGQILDRNHARARSISFDQRVEQHGGGEGEHHVGIAPSSTRSIAVWPIP